MEYDSVEYFPEGPTLPDDMVMTEDQQKLIKVSLFELNYFHNFIPCISFSCDVTSGKGFKMKNY